MTVINRQGGEPGALSLALVLITTRGLVDRARE